MRNARTTRVYLDVELDNGTEVEVHLEVTLEAAEPDVGWNGACYYTILGVSGTDIPPDVEDQLKPKLEAISDSIEARAMENLE